MQAIRETASNIAASAISGMEKTKATVQEKVEIMSAQHPMEKQMATQKKEERIAQAERTKLAAQRHNALVRQLSLSGAHAGAAPTSAAAAAAKATIRTQSLPARSATTDAMVQGIKLEKMPASARAAGDGGTNSAQLLTDAAASGGPANGTSQPEAAAGGASEPTLAKDTRVEEAPAA